MTDGIADVLSDSIVLYVHNDISFRRLIIMIPTLVTFTIRAMIVSYVMIQLLKYFKHASARTLSRKYLIVFQK